MLTVPEQDIVEAILIQIQIELEKGVRADATEAGECRVCYQLARDYTGLLTRWLSEKRHTRKKLDSLKTLQALQAAKNNNTKGDNDDTRQEDNDDTKQEEND